jgi:two-component system OmpR family response regulator
MDLDQHLVFVNDAPVDLSPTEFRLLHFFLENRNKVISKDTLLAEVWGIETYLDPNVVETYVSYLRKKFGANLPLRTVRGVGYQLNDRSPT